MSGTGNALGKGSVPNILMTGLGAGWSTGNRYSEEAQSPGMEASPSKILPLYRAEG